MNIKEVPFYFLIVYLRGLTPLNRYNNLYTSGSLQDQQKLLLNKLIYCKSTLSINTTRTKNAAIKQTSEQQT